MNSIVIPAHFIQAARDSGYRGLAAALAELIDNALDAGASEVDIRLAETRLEGEREITISTLDNGRGMDKTTLWESLRFGGSERFNGRESLGRYGMGLPNSSVSQAPRVEVYSWQDGRSPLRAHLDVNEIAERHSHGIAEPVACALPSWVARRTRSGTLVEWSRCDRLRFKKSATLVRKLHPALGQMYRHSLTDQLTIRVNGASVQPVDPLFRDCGLPGTCAPYGEPIHYTFKTPAGGTSVVTVQFVELPVARWQDLPTETKRAMRIVGGAGMSVLRGGREIDYGWHLFGRKRQENYDDWWRAELRFDPALDEIFGITHSKQGINPAPELREILEPDLESIARELNVRVRRAFSRLKPTPTSCAAKRASDRDRMLPAAQASGCSARRPAGEGFQFRIGFHDETTPEFFTANVEGSAVRLEINQNHPFYKRLYAPASRDSGDFDVLLLAAARALLDLSQDTRQTLLRSWSDNLLVYLAR